MVAQIIIETIINIELFSTMTKISNSNQTKTSSLFYDLRELYCLESKISGIYEHIDSSSAIFFCFNKKWKS